MQSDGTVDIKKGGNESGVDTMAQNLMEHGNTNACVGPGVSVDYNLGYPEGWEVQPIGGSLLCTTSKKCQGAGL